MSLRSTAHQGRSEQLEPPSLKVSGLPRELMPACIASHRNDGREPLDPFPLDQVGEGRNFAFSCARSLTTGLSHVSESTTRPVLWRERAHAHTR